MTRRGRILVGVALLALALLLTLYWTAQPSRVARFVTHRVGATLGLEITAQGASEYRLRGTPMLVLRDVTVREPGAGRPLLTARRLLVELPWSTLRAGGRDLVIRRIELDAPQLDLAALQLWRASRPPTAARLPTLTDGLRIRDGTIVGKGWRIERVALDVPLLDARRPLRARLGAHYRDPPLAMPFDVAVALTRPEALVRPLTSGFAAHGRIGIVRAGAWRMHGRIALSGPLTLDDDGIRLAPARMGLGATLETGESRVPLAVGLYGALRFDDATLIASPARLALRGRGSGRTDPVPDVDAHGLLALGAQLRLRLDGEIARWPPAWPALPPPIGQSRSPLPFALDYRGAPALTDVTTLDVRRDATRFTGRLRVPQVLDWIEQAERGHPLPPLTGTLDTPRMEIAGATLEGIEIDFGDGAVAP